MTVRLDCRVARDNDRSCLIRAVLASASGAVTCCVRVLLIVDGCICLQVVPGIVILTTIAALITETNAGAIKKLLLRKSDQRASHDVISTLNGASCGKGPG